MKILFLAFNIRTIGGIQQYNKKFLDALYELEQNVKFVELQSTGFISKLRFVFTFFFWVVVFRPRIVICTNLNFSPLCYIASKLFGAPYSVTVYGIEVVRLSNMYKKTLLGAKFILKLFNHTAEMVLAQIPEAKDRILSLPNSVNSESFFIKEKSKKLIARHNLENCKIVLTLTRISKSDGDNKGYERVIEAFPRVLQKVPNARYVLVGGGDDMPRMKEKVRTLGISAAVVFVGPIKDEERIDYYNLGDVFILPSKNEGFPAIVLLEALACGIPVIGGNQAGSDEALWQKEVGLIVSSDDREAIAKALIDVLTGATSKTLFDREFLRKRILREYGASRYKEYVRGFLDQVSL